MPKAKLLCAGGTLLFLVAASPVFGQVTMLNGDDTLNPAPAATPISPGLGSPNVPPATDYIANSLIVTGPVNKNEAAPNINLDKLLSVQSGAPTVSDARGEKH
jgi:hypothetical protein